MRLLLALAIVCLAGCAETPAAPTPPLEPPDGAFPVLAPPSGTDDEFVIVGAELVSDGAKNFGLGIDLWVGERRQLRTQHGGVDRTNETTWTSNRDDIADFPDSPGRIRGRKAGTAWITARWGRYFRTLRAVVSGADPPYQGTVFITPRLIERGDPSSFRSVEFAGRGERDIFDRRIGTWTTADVFLFNVRYSGLALEFQVNPEFGSVEAARREVDTYAPAFGQLPAFLMTGAREVEIHAGNELAGGNTHNGTFHIHSGAGQTYIRDGFLEEVLFHEAAHVSLDRLHATRPAWREAQTTDGRFISTYARDQPDREDVAESVLTWYAVRRRSERLSAADRTLILETIPNRLGYFDRQGFVD